MTPREIEDQRARHNDHVHDREVHKKSWQQRYWTAYGDGHGRIMAFFVATEFKYFFFMGIILGLAIVFVSSNAHNH